MHMSPAVLGPPIFLSVYLKAVRAGFPSPADDYLDQPIDLSRTLIQNAPATFIMTVAGDSAIDVGIFDGSLITVDRSLVPKDGDAIVVDVNGERSIKVFRIVGGRSSLAFGNRQEWFVPYYVDVGTGDSDLTWQAIAGIGYAFGWGEVLAAWRYLDYKFKSGDKVEDLTFNGPAIGVAFRW